MPLIRRHQLGHRTDGLPSSGPVANAPNAASDTTSPDTALTNSLNAAAPATGTVSTGTTAYRQAFTFDWIGNRASLTEHNTADATKNVTFKYGYGSTGPTTQPHTLSSITSAPSGQGSTYTSDPTGNTETRTLPSTTQALGWTAENKLDTVTTNGVKTSYIYDAEGNRILENSPSGSTLYLGETELTTDAAGKITKASRAYGHAGAPTVVRTTTNGATTGHKLNVLISDHLGTANTTVELGGTQTVTRRAFKPYGEARGPKPSTWPNKRSYLGVGIDDSATGLTHIGAREYDQAAGRFLSADPVIDIADPLQMNGYAYSNNSPISKSDPTGLKLFEGDNQRGFDSNPATGNSNAKKNTQKSQTNNYYDGPIAIRMNVTNITFKNYKMFHKAWNAVIKREGPNLLKHWDPNQDCLDYGLGCFPNPAGGISFGVAHIMCGVEGVSCDHEKSWLGIYAGQVLDTVALEVGLSKTLGLKALAPGKLRGAAGGPCSFSADTPVLLEHGKSKAIGKVKPGDKVEAGDPRTGKHRGPRTVTAKLVHHDYDLVDLKIRNGQGKTYELHTTSRHPFWDDTTRTWIDAGKLTPGHTLNTANDEHAVVVAVKVVPGSADMQNLTVDDLHTYYVLAGETPVLVHNSNCDFKIGVADEKYDKHVLGLDDSGNPTRRPDMPEYDTDDGFERYVADAQALMCPGSCPAAAREAVRSDGVIIRMDSQGRIGMRDGNTISTYFRPDDPLAYFQREAAR